MITRECFEGQAKEVSIISDSLIELEKVHIVVFYALSILFIVCGIIANRRQKNTEEYPKQPSLTYLKMRFETSKYFAKQTGESSTFDNLRLLISSAIVQKLDMQVIQSDKENKITDNSMGLIREEVGKVFQHIRKSFTDISWKEREKSRIRKAIIFEANRRFIEHPSDLRGLRHARYFKECLYDYLRKEENPRSSHCSLKRYISQN